MLDNGGNLAPRAPTLAYVIDDRGGGPRVEWSDQPVAITVAEALRPEAGPALGGEPASERLECDDWLRTFLADGLTSTTEVFKAGHVAGFSKDQVRRAKVRLGAVAARKASTGTLNGAGNYPLMHLVLEIIRRLHEGSEDCRFAGRAIFGTFVQSSRADSVS